MGGREGGREEWERGREGGMGEREEGRNGREGGRNGREGGREEWEGGKEGGMGGREKRNWYTDLMEQIDGSTYSGSLVILEVESHGCFSLPSFTLLKQKLLICTRKQWEDVLINFVRTVITGVHTEHG